MFLKFNFRIPKWLKLGSNVQQATQNTQLIVDAIKEAERNTSGEIRVFIDTFGSKKDIMERTKKAFQKEKMYFTQQRNAVLFYIDVKYHRIAIWADKGIYHKVGKEYWRAVVEAILLQIKMEKDWIKGLHKGILELGKILKQYYPYEDKGDMNELKDEVIIK
ncbi:MAG: TPM domain-containing protein [Chitinophagaceae bacterium]